MLSLGPGASPATDVSQLLQAQAKAVPPIVVVLGGPDLSQRDNCLIAGAGDVSVSGLPDDVAERVNAAVRGWVRGQPRRKLRATFRAQRGRQFFDLKVAEIDPTGFTVTAVEGLREGMLVRTQLALPDGELLAWGRMSTAEEAVGVRLLGLLPQEQQRLSDAIKRRADSVASVLPVPAAPPLTSKAPPADNPVELATEPPSRPTEQEPGDSVTVRDLPPVSMAPPLASGTPETTPAGDLTERVSVEGTGVAATAPAVPPAPASTPGSAPSPASQPTSPVVAKEARVNVRTSESKSVPSVARTSVTKPSFAPAAAAATTPDVPVLPSATPPASPDPSLAPPPAPAVSAPAPTTGASNRIDIADAIGHALDEGTSASDEVTLAQRRLVDGAVSPAAAPPVTWPTTTYDAEASAGMLREACLVGMVGEYPGGPSGELVIQFMRKLSVSEQHAFDAAPPAELPEQSLTIRALALRLRIFALIRDADRVTERVAIDQEVLSRLSAEVKSVNADLQKVIDAFVAKAQTKQIREVNHFRNQLGRAHNELLHDVVSRLKGEQTSRSNIALLDVESVAPTPASVPAKRDTGSISARREPEPPKKTDSVPVVGPALEASPRQRLRRRLIVEAALVGALALVAVVAWPARSRVLTPAELGTLPDVTHVRISPRNHRAFIVVSSAWKPDHNHLAALEALSAAEKLESFTVETEKGNAVASKMPGKGIVALETLAPPPPKK